MELEPIVTILLTMIGSVVASSGFWSYIQRKSDKEDYISEMLIGLGHDRIMYLGMSYIERGWISKDEYENLHDYLYIPYVKLGGNGSAKKVMNDIEHLPIRKNGGN